MKKINKKKLLSSLMLLTLAINPISTYAYTKTETVYSNLDYNGTIKDITVNNHLSKLTKEKVEDEAILSQITNLNGEESFTKDSNNIIWNASGKDIFYQGKTKEELPISVSIDYYLDGKKTSPKKMLNKKGNITIKISLKNNSYNQAKKLHTPFVVTTGLILDSTKDKGIKITNGEVEETGTRSIALALAAPGLYDDLKIKELESLDEITISYETEKFTLNNIYFFITPKLLEKIDITNLNKVNTLETSIKTIQENMDKLDNGAKDLNLGAATISKATNEVNSNLKILLDSLKKVESASNTIDDGLEKVVTSLEEAKRLLEDKNVEGSLANIEELINTNENTIFLLNQTNNSLKSTYDTYGLASFNNDSELISYFTNLSLDEATINNLLTCKKTYESNQNLLKLLNANTQTIKTMSTSIEELYQNINNLLTELTPSLKNLETASKTASNGLSEINRGVEKLYGGTNSLSLGTNDLEIGTTTLSNGITTLNQEGINKLSNSTSKISNYTAKVQDLIKLSKEYQGFSSSNSNKTTFIYKVKSAK